MANIEQGDTTVGPIEGLQYASSVLREAAAKAGVR